MRKFWLSVAAVAAATGLLTGCSGAGDSSDSERGGATPTPRFTWSEEASALDPSRDVRIVKSGFEDHKDWGRHAYVVHYTITNGGSGAANYFVQFEFLDKDDDVLGKTGVTVDRLGPGKTETNDSALLDSEIENGSVEDIASVHVTQVERT
ncbi:hypothetical protein [Streptomyces sp. NBC_01217]|uniref:hypothetical protein n=1 Tax=Streptomyces sp. NBC_01217 TaxID=2903779 RepID=UPI002E1257B6|nr:hypothetical protein OG507_28860 [Streptomyces sp. NBC_01217]